MDDKTYNGWANYETWVTALWMENEQNDYQATRELASEYKSQEVYLLADALKEYVNENMINTDRAGLAADLVNAALSEVDWMEIAQNLVDEM